MQPKSITIEVPINAIKNAFNVFIAYTSLEIPQQTPRDVSFTTAGWRRRALEQDV